MKALFLNHKIENCGVYQYGKRVSEILLKDEKIVYIYKEIDSFEEYTSVLTNNLDVSFIIYNYHSSTMPWLNSSNIQKNVKNIGIPHESPEHLFDIICNIDPDACENTNKISLPRPIYENVDELISKEVENEKLQSFINAHTDSGFPIFGSFGFGFSNKGFDKIVKFVNEQYENAIVKFVIPHAYFDTDIETPFKAEQKCLSENIKPGIILMFCFEFISNANLLKFLKSNTMNIFLYDKMEGRGTSSTIDYALSVKTPLAISDSYMFRHIYSDDICLYKNTIENCVKKSLSYCSVFLEKYSHKNMIEKFRKLLQNEKKIRGIFYNSRKSLCSIWESGKMCYDALVKSEKFSLDYSEECCLDFSYDFSVFNQHNVNNWMTEEIIKQFNKPTFCIVTEVTFSQNPTDMSPQYYDHYIVLDPTINETEKNHAFGRPIENIDLSMLLEDPIETIDNPLVFSFGFATPGKDWHKIVELVQKEYDTSTIHFNIPRATHVPWYIHDSEVNILKSKCQELLTKPGIILKITHDELTKEELIKLCAKSTINCFLYNRQHIYSAGLSAVTDQAISAGRPILVSGDRTFRHLHKYINYCPNIGVREAIEKNCDGVLKMRNDWSAENFMKKFEGIIFKTD